jgi:hypothetical protein
MRRDVPLFACCCSAVFFGACLPSAADDIDLSAATIVIRQGELPAAEKVAPVVLTEEIQKRTGLAWKVTTDWPAAATSIIALSAVSSPPGWRDRIPAAALQPAALERREGFSIFVQPKTDKSPAVVFVTGADPRGLLFGVGKLLRSVAWGERSVRLADGFQAAEAPEVPLRGHQLGFRARANSWDAWTVAQFDQYIRELVIFGANAVENIPFEDSQPSPVMKVSREEMNAAMSEICARYDVEYWVWVPVLFLLPNPDKEAAFLQQQEAFYRSCQRLDAVFVPGGDPGENEALPLLRYLRDMASVLRKHHPRAKVWLSLQYFKPKDVDDFYHFVHEHQPDWFGGVVMGPSSPPLEPTRARLEPKYPIRWYPDITHTVRCQYPVPWLDPAFGMTLGRECVNPRPVDFTAIYRELYRFTNGFLTYSDGVHDDVNKNLWTALGWNSAREPRETILEYARFFFRPDLAEPATDALLALESNWRGGVANNGAIDGTLLQWQKLEEKLPMGRGNWRFEMHLMRAYYDAYTRQRLIYETELERQALRDLDEVEASGPDATLARARRTLERASVEPIRQDWYAKIDALAVSLFETIGLQTSVERFHGSGSERGCVMDFVNYPLNNRWWLEHQFDRIAQLDDRAERTREIRKLHDWAVPPPGSFYDDIGNVAESPRAPKFLNSPEAGRYAREIPSPTIRSLGEKRRNVRYGWHSYLNRPAKMVYAGLDPQATYTVRLFSQHLSPLEIDGTPAKLIRQGEVVEDNLEQEYEVPAEALTDGRLELTWTARDESALNWRQRHYVTELWVIKRAKK